MPPLRFPYYFFWRCIYSIVQPIYMFSYIVGIRIRINRVNIYIYLRNYLRYGHASRDDKHAFRTIRFVTILSKNQWICDNVLYGRAIGIQLMDEYDSSSILRLCVFLPPVAGQQHPYKYYRSWAWPDLSFMNRTSMTFTYKKEKILSTGL